jgi:hypothetical protein
MNGRHRSRDSGRRPTNAAFLITGSSLIRIPQARRGAQ